MEITEQENIEALIDDIASLDTAIRDDAHMKLIALGSRAVKPLLAAMSRQGERVSWEAAVILAQIDDPRWVIPMLDALTSNNPILGQIAVQALERFGGKYIDTLIVSLPSCHFMVQLHIVGALGRFGERRAVVPLMDLLQSTDSSSLRCEIIQALGLIGDPEAVERIRSFQNDEDHHVCKRVRIALQRIADASPNAATGDLR